MLRVRLLGGLALEAGGRPLDPPASRPARELLAWLALHPGAHPRLDLAMRFWPDVLESSARASLRTTLHELRRALGDAASHLVVDRERVGLTDTSVDLLELDHLDRPEEAYALAAAGEPLTGIDRDWAVAARDAHRERVAALLARLADGAPDSETGLRWARESVRRDPLSEDAAQRLMRLLAAAGDRAAALSAYVRLEDRLQRELSVPPSRQTRRLLAEIRAGAAPPLGTATRAPLPPALQPRGGPLAGREPELQRLTEATRGTAVLLAGEPGIGKTRLLAEAGRRAHERGATVSYGRCYEEPVAPYEPFQEALGSATFTRLVDAAGSERRQLFETVAERLGGSLLVLDDLHWADAGSLRLLAHLLRRPRPPVVLGAYRDSEISRAHPLAATLADLRRDGLIERVPVTGLPAPAVAQLVAARHGPDDLADALHRETGGNPFYIEEVLRHLAATPLSPGEPLPIPEGVKDVIGRRLSRLAPETERVLSVAAVAGREFDLTLVEAVLEADALAAIEEAGGAQMVREEPGRPGRFAFAHALVRETLYDELSLTRRVRTHRALADALERQPGHRLAELAHHRLQAAAADGGAQAADAALAAAAEAMRALAYEDAAALCERALTALEETPREHRRRAELWLALGEARLRSGEPARAAFAQAAELARELAPDLLARAALGFSGLGVTIIAVDHDAVGLLEEALAAIGDDHPLRARLVARLAIETYYVSTPAERKALGDEAVELARPAGGAALIDALNARHAALWSAQFLDERLATAREMLDLAIAAGDAERELQARNWLVTDLMEQGDIAGARTEIEAHERLAERLRLPAYTWWGPMWRATLAILEGRFEDAAGRIAQLASVTESNARLYVEIQSYQLDWQQGRFEDIDEAPLEREVGRPAEYAYRSGFSWVLAAQGRADRAREQIAWVAAGDFARLADDMNRLAALAELAQAVALLEDPTHAAGVHARLVPYADRNITNGRGAAGYGSAAYHLAVLEALLGRDAAPRFEEALRRNAALGSRPWLERTRARYEAYLERRA